MTRQEIEDWSLCSTKPAKSKALHVSKVKTLLILLAAMASADAGKTIEKQRLLGPR